MVARLFLSADGCNFPAPFSRREQLVFPTTELKGAQLKVGRVINHSLKKASESP